jgi:insulysin
MPHNATQHHTQVMPVPAAWLERWSDISIPTELHLPASNPFVPTDLTLVASPEEHRDSQCKGGKQQLPPRGRVPRLLTASRGVRLWHRTELRFEQPKLAVVLDFQVCGCVGGWG